MAHCKGPKTQFGKIPTRIPSQPLFCLPTPRGLRSARGQRSAPGHGWDRFASLHSISVSGLVGGGRRRRRMGTGWGSKRAAEPPLRDPRLRSRSGSQASSQDPRTSASARAQSCLGAACPAPRRLRSERPAPTPVALHFAHPTLRPQTPPPSVPRTLDTPRPLNTVSGHPTFWAPRARKPPYPGFPRLGHLCLILRVLGPLYAMHLSPGAPRPQTLLCSPVPSALALHLLAHCLWPLR